jgi:hypothetical protein
MNNLIERAEAWYCQTAPTAQNPLIVIDQLFENLGGDQDDLHEQLYRSSLKKFLERIVQAWVKGQIDNGSLYAGSSMYYYCKHCGLLSDTLPEGWFMQGPSRVCKACSDMKEWLKDGIALANHLGLRPPKGPYDDKCPFDVNVVKGQLVKT